MSSEYYPHYADISGTYQRHIIRPQEHFASKHLRNCSALLCRRPPCRVYWPPVYGFQHDALPRSPRARRALRSIWEMATFGDIFHFCWTWIGRRQQCWVEQPCECAGKRTWEPTCLWHQRSARPILSGTSPNSDNPATARGHSVLAYYVWTFSAALW